MTSILPGVILSLLSCTGNNDTAVQNVSKPVRVPLYFGLSDYFYQNNGPTLVQVKNDKAEVIFEHRGKWKNWGSSTLEGEFKETGTYNVTITYYLDSTGKNQESISDEFLLEGNEEAIDIVIQLDHDKAIIINKYFGNEYGLKLERLWDPEKQFAQPGAKILPEYNVINLSDSVVYGIYHRFSSSLAISWVQLHYIAFLGYQHYVNGKWVADLSCNAPRIQMDLKAGMTGNTLKDIVNDCEISNFKKGDRYRIVFEYGVNNKKVRPGNIKDTIPGHFYVEQPIYCIYDEFTVK